LNNRAENSYQPRREGTAHETVHISEVRPAILAAYGFIASHFRPRRHRLPRNQNARLRQLAGGNQHPGNDLMGDTLDR
jgi:hypothetical protein